MVERNFECGRCHAKAIVRVPAVGAKDHAREADADRALRLAVCPVCHERPANAIAFAALRIGVIAFGAAVATWMIGATMMGMRYGALAQLWALMPIVLIGVAGWLASVTLRRWRATTSIEVVRLLEAAPERAVPKAVAQIVEKIEKKPVIEVPPAPQPIATRAPETIERASDGEGPRFLR